jgi:hypothetical protein
MKWHVYQISELFFSLPVLNILSSSLEVSLAYLSLIEAFIDCINRIIPIQLQQYFVYVLFLQEKLTYYY